MTTTRNDPPSYADACARRIMATAGVMDMVRSLVQQIHHVVKVGKGDADAGVGDALDRVTGKHREKKDKKLSAEEQEAEDARTLKQIQKRQAKRDKSKPNPGDTTADGDDPGTADQTAAKSKKKKKAKKDPQAETTTPGDASTRDGSAKPEHPIPPEPQPKPPKAPPQAHPPKGPSHSFTPPPHPAEPKAKKPKQPGGGGALRAAKPNEEPDHNSVHGADTKTATKDIEVHGKINGRNMTTTISAGQQYHVKKDGGRTQLVMPGLFGRFMVDDADAGRL